MTGFKSYAGLLCLLAISVAGCSRGAGVVPMNSVSAGSPMTRVTNLDNRRGCQNDGDVTVIPCSIKFNSNNPGPVDVSVSQNGDRNRGGNGGGIQERDNCASRNIATIVRSSKAVYTVTAGSAHGSCDALFTNGGGHNGRGHRNDNGGRNGNGNLHVTNDL